MAQGKDIKQQVWVNMNDIKWLKQNLKDVQEQNRFQTQLLFTILLTILGGIIGAGILI